MPQSGVLAHDDETTTEHTERSLSPAMVSQTNLGGNTVDMALPSASPGTGGPIEQKLFVRELPQVSSLTGRPNLRSLCLSCQLTVQLRDGVVLVCSLLICSCQALAVLRQVRVCLHAASGRDIPPICLRVAVVPLCRRCIDDRLAIVLGSDLLMVEPTARSLDSLLDPQRRSRPLSRASRKRHDYPREGETNCGTDPIEVLRHLDLLGKSTLGCVNERGAV